MFTIGAVDLDAVLAAFFYPFFRIVALASSAPVLGHSSVPPMVRIALAVLVTAIVAPALPAVAAVSPFGAPGVLLMIEQVLIGLAIGLAMQIAFAAVTLAGDLIGLQMGLSFAAFIDPQNSEQAPLVGSFLSITLMLVFLAINGHLLLIAALVDSFNAFPLRLDAVRGLDAVRLVRSGADLFAFGLQIALPIIGAMLLTNLTLGMLARTSPQLNLLAVGFAVTLSVGLLMLFLELPMLAPGFEHILHRGLTTFR
ncbi:MAG: flagellar biosynthetic protein FliR [Pseudomonadota bacterium]|nr:flagellar biosynthetic protein FliR [Pseudomonadota bacterium]